MCTLADDESCWLSCSIFLAAADEYDATETTVAEINRLEAAITLRRLREAGADDAGGSQTGRDWMKAQEAKIATERGKL